MTESLPFGNDACVAEISTSNAQRKRVTSYPHPTRSLFLHVCPLDAFSTPVLYSSSVGFYTCIPGSSLAVELSPSGNLLVLCTDFYVDSTQQSYGFGRDRITTSRSLQEFAIKKHHKFLLTHSAISQWSLLRGFLSRMAPLVCT